MLAVTAFIFIVALAVVPVILSLLTRDLNPVLSISLLFFSTLFVLVASWCLPTFLKIGGF